jgi:hypothetical protein
MRAAGSGCLGMDDSRQRGGAFRLIGGREARLMFPPAVDSGDDEMILDGRG